MGIKEDIERFVRQINRAHRASQFPKYIDSIRFPYYKSLCESAEITFDFPLTVLIGINGSGKTSALHAIYGCPENSSTGTYWFTTPLDPIRQNRRKGEIPSIIYTYRKDGEAVEVIKRRSGVSKGLDYWETSRPIKMYGMLPLEDGKRNRPIKMDVKFLDFRSELSAFDKFFHFGTFKNRKTITSKQDYLRKYSEYVRQAIVNPIVVNKYRRSNTPARRFSPDLIRILSNILGKSYSYCAIVVHNFYGDEGATVMFNYNDKRYSEAFAGRGEFAIAKLIYEISRAKIGTLIILDEPEVSLHPSAQERLKIFLLEACLEKKLQIVLSTHSPKLIEFLPDKAIKLFYEGEDGKFNILNNCSYYEAFHVIGERINSADKRTIIVEDNLAKELVDNILNELGGDYPLLFQVVNYPGGAEDIYKASVSYCQENENNKYIILDGDKKNLQFTPRNFTVEQSQDIIFIEEKVKQVTNCNIKKLGFRLDGNGIKANLEQKIATFTKYLEFNFDHLAYFPLNTPEEIIWNDTFANNMLSNINTEMPESISNFKSKFCIFSKLQFGSEDANTINSTHKMFIRDFIKRKNEHFESIARILKKFKDDNLYSAK